MPQLTNIQTFFESSTGDLIAVIVANNQAASEQSAAPEYTLLDFAPGSSQGVPVLGPDGNVLYTENFVVDASGAIFAAWDGTDTFTNGSAAPTMV